MVSHVALSEVTTVLLGQTFRGKAEASDSTSGVRLVQIRDIREGIITDITQLGFAEIDRDKVSFQVQFDDLLLPVRGSRIEAALFKADTTFHPVTTTNQVAILRNPSPELRLEYLLWYLNSALGRAALDAITYGSSVPSINRASLVSLSIPLPPLTTQDRIIGMYLNWQQQKHVLGALLENGQRLTDTLCSEWATSQRETNE